MSHDTAFQQSNKQLSILCLVSKRIRQIVLPILYEFMAFKLYIPAELQRAYEKRGGKSSRVKKAIDDQLEKQLNLFNRYAGICRHLQIECFRSMNSFMESCLQSFFERIPWSSISHNCPRMKCLKISGLNIAETEQVEEFKFALQHLRELEHLAIVNSSRPMQQLVRPLEIISANAATSLMKLCYSCTWQYDDNIDEWVNAFMTKRMQDHGDSTTFGNQLTELCIEFVGLVSSHDIKRILNACQNLRYLDVGQIKIESQEDVLTLLELPNNRRVPLRKLNLRLYKCLMTLYLLDEFKKRYPGMTVVLGD